MAGHDHVEVTKEIIDCSPPLAEACAIQRIVIVKAHRDELGLLRDRPDASLLLRARWIAQTRRRSALQMTRRNSMAYLKQEAAARAVNGRVSAANTRGVSGRAGLYGGWRSVRGRRGARTLRGAGRSPCRGRPRRGR